VQTDGTFLPAWTTVVSRWAEIKPATGRELPVGDRRQAEVSHTITVRPYDLKPNQRIIRGTRVFNIVAVLDIDSRSDFITVLVSEVPAVEAPTDA
jgi:head-tail adaptor